MQFSDLNKEMIVFSYRISPNFGKEGDNGGFLLELLGNGNLRLARYRLFDEIKMLKIFKLNREETEEIFNFLISTQEIWKDIPEVLENDTVRVPGNTNEFIFLNWKRIEAHNIRKTWIPAEKIIHRKYYEDHKKIIQYENQLIEIFEGISKILKKNQIHLQLEKCLIAETCKVKVKWIDKTKHRKRKCEEEVS